MNYSWHRHDAAQKLALHEMHKWGLIEDGWALSPYSGAPQIDYNRNIIAVDISQIWWDTDECSDLTEEDKAVVVDAIRHDIAHILADSPYHDTEWKKAAIMVDARIGRRCNWHGGYGLPNKNQLKVQKLALREMSNWGLIEDGWTFYWDTRARPNLLGTCNYDSKSVQLSEHTIDHHYDEVKVMDTVRHEIAHALAGPGEGHGSEWRKAAVMTGAGLGHYREDRIISIICVAITIVSLAVIAYIHIGR